jgi:hypothetical protein
MQLYERDEFLHAFYLVQFCDGSDEENLEKSKTETLAMRRRAFREESMGHAWKVQTHRD